MHSTSRRYKIAWLLPVLLSAALTPLRVCAQNETTDLYARCSAAFRATDYVTATSVCIASAEANFTEANEFITDRHTYYLDLLFGADSQETAGEAYVYGHIDDARGNQLIDSAMVTLRQILAGATDSQTLQMARNMLAEATSFKSRMLQSGSF